MRLQTFDDAESEFAKAQDAKLTVTTPTVQLQRRRGRARQGHS